MPLEKLNLNTKGKDNVESKFLVLSSAPDCLSAQEQRPAGAQLYGHQNIELAEMKWLHGLFHSQQDSF